MAHGDAREGKWRGNWRMEWVASTLHATTEHGVSSVTTADAHTSAASSRLNWLPRRFKWTRPFRRKTKSGFCACAITFQTQSTSLWSSFGICYIYSSYEETNIVSGINIVLELGSDPMWVLHGVMMHSVGSLPRYSVVCDKGYVHYCNSRWRKTRCLWWLNLFSWIPLKHVNTCYENKHLQFLWM
jgi:hypothetical protein